MTLIVDAAAQPGLTVSRQRLDAADAQAQRLAREALFLLVFELRLRSRARC